MYGFHLHYFYQIVEGNRLAFLIRIILDSLAVIFTLLALPSEQMLSKSNLNLEAIYQDSKKNWAVIMLIWNLSLNTYDVIVDAAEFTERIEDMVMALVLIPLVLKYNNLYLHTVFQIVGILMMFLLLLVTL